MVKLKPILQIAIPIFISLIAEVCYPQNQDDAISNPLYVDPATRDFSTNPDLLDRILSSPHGYFRFINIRFSEEVCQRFRDIIQVAPSLNLHGDAHIEQYAVTDLGRGLTDFDDSSTGPGIIDLMRFGVSLRLTCRARGWQDRSDALFQEFLRGYSDALRQPDIEAPKPKVASRIRSKFKSDRKSYFEWIDSIMQPLPEADQDSLLEAIKPYVETMLLQDPKLNSAFFTVVKFGYVRLGIGSALDIKYLIRVRGETDDFADDVVLEAKQVRDLSGIDCISSGQRIDPFRILLGQARISYQPFKYLGYFKFRDHSFWVHAWVENYKEVTIGKTFQSIAELARVAYDVGVQLGKGHVRHIGAPLDLQLRLEELRLITRRQEEIKQGCVELESLTLDAWAKFKKNIEFSKASR